MESNVFWKVGSNMDITPGNRCEEGREKEKREKKGGWGRLTEEIMCDWKYNEQMRTFHSLSFSR